MNELNVHTYIHFECNMNVILNIQKIMVKPMNAGQLSHHFVIYLFNISIGSVSSIKKYLY